MTHRLQNDFFFTCNRKSYTSLRVIACRPIPRPLNVVNILILCLKVKAEVGDVSILVNNAGVVYTSDLFATQDPQIEKTFEVNILAHFWVSMTSFTKNNPFCVTQGLSLK